MRQVRCDASMRIAVACTAPSAHACGTLAWPRACDRGSPASCTRAASPARLGDRHVADPARLGLPPLSLPRRFHAGRHSYTGRACKFEPPCCSPSSVAASAHLRLCPARRPGTRRLGRADLRWAGSGRPPGTSPGHVSKSGTPDDVAFIRVFTSQSTTTPKLPSQRTGCSVETTRRVYVDVQSSDANHRSTEQNAAAKNSAVRSGSRTLRSRTLRSRTQRVRHRARHRARPLPLRCEARCSGPRTPAVEPSAVEPSAVEPKGRGIGRGIGRGWRTRSIARTDAGPSAVEPSAVEPRGRGIGRGIGRVWVGRAWMVKRADHRRAHHAPTTATRAAAHRVTPSKTNVGSIPAGISCPLVPSR